MNFIAPIINLVLETLIEEEYNALILYTFFAKSYEDSDDIKHLIFYDKCKSLFTEKNGTKMHMDVLNYIIGK